MRDAKEMFNAKEQCCSVDGGTIYVFREAVYVVFKRMAQRVACAFRSPDKWLSC